MRSPAYTVRVDGNPREMKTMSDTALRAKLIRLAHSNPELREAILPLVSDRKAAVMDDRKVQALFDSWGDYVAGVFDDNSVRGNPAKMKRGFRLVEKLRAQYAAGTPLDKIQAEWNRYKRSISGNAARAMQPDGEDGLGWDLFASKAASRTSDRTNMGRTAAWENLPEGWTEDSVQSFWDSLTGDVKHKITKCMTQMEGKVTDTGAFCGSLASQVGYRAASAGSLDATTLRRAAIRVAHEDPSVRAEIVASLPR